MQEKEYAQVYEFGLGSLIGDFFQNVKDTVTGVARAVAPIAPYVLPFLPGGPITKQLIGAGISLAAGQKPVDIAKNMALQAATSGIASSLSGGKFGQSFGDQLKSIGLGGSSGQGTQLGQSNLSQALNYNANMPSSTIGSIDPNMSMGTSISNTQPVNFQVNTPPIDFATPSTEKSFFSKAGDFFMDTFDPRRRTENPRYLALKNRGFSDADIIKMGVNPESSAYYQYAPAAYAAFTGIGALDQLLNPPEESTGYDEAERERFTFSYARPRNTGDGLTAIPGAPVDDTSFISQPFEPSVPKKRAQEIADQFGIPMLVAADGGEVTGGVANNGQRIEHPDGKVKEHPKRIGEITGPGTGTSDDIPAMLSDGEFVMTAQAVRNAGGGSRKQGAKNMYKMMKSLEKGGSLSQQSIGMA